MYVKVLLHADHQLSKIKLRFDPQITKQNRKNRVRSLETQKPKHFEHVRSNMIET